MEVKLKAVILAAGIGSRLGELTQDKPKSLLKINEQTLIEYQIEILQDFGIRNEDIYIIAGHKFEILKNFLSNRYHVNFIFNSKYQKWNNIYSFYLIKTIPFITENFLLINSDTLFHRNIMENVSKVFSDSWNYLVVDVDKKLDVEEMKVLIEHGFIKKIDKSLNPKTANGEYIGLAKFNRPKLNTLFQCIESQINQGLTYLWYENSLDLALDSLRLKYIPTMGYPWIEIDTLEDYQMALKLRFDKK